MTLARKAASKKGGWNLGMTESRVETLDHEAA